jgi:hypothetical protein
MQQHRQSRVVIGPKWCLMGYPKGQSKEFEYGYVRLALFSELCAE